MIMQVIQVTSADELDLAAQAVFSKHPEMQGDWDFLSILSNVKFWSILQFWDFYQIIYHVERLKFQMARRGLEVGSGLAAVLLVTAAISCLIYCSVKWWWHSEVLDMQLCFCGLNDFCRVAKGTQVSFLQVHHLGHFPHWLLWWCSTTYGGWVLQEFQTNSPHSLGTLVNIMSNHNTWCPIDDVCLYLRINCVQENNLVFSLYILGCRLYRKISLAIIYDAISCHCTGWAEQHYILVSCVCLYLKFYLQTCLA